MRRWSSRACGAESYAFAASKKQAYVAGIYRRSGRRPQHRVELAGLMQELCVSVCERTFPRCGFTRSLYGNRKSLKHRASQKHRTLTVAPCIHTYSCQVDRCLRLSSSTELMLSSSGRGPGCPQAVCSTSAVRGGGRGAGSPVERSWALPNFTAPPGRERVSQGCLTQRCHASALCSSV